MNIPNGFQCRALLLTPLDTLFCRDGRPFGSSTVASGGLPHPQTLAGALRTHAIRSLNVDTGKQIPYWPQLLREMQIRGPWLTRQDKDDGNDKDNYKPLFPTPADLICHAKQKPKQPRGLKIPATAPPNWHDPNKLLPLWYDQDDNPVEPLGGFITCKGMQTYLEGRLPGQDELIEPKKLYTHEPRTGIEIHADQLAAVESQIYSINMLRLCMGVKLYAEILFPNDAAEHANQAFPKDGSWILALGGEGRRVHVQVVTPIPWPQAKSLNNHVAAVLISPARFEDGRRSLPPIHLDGWILKAAGVPGYTSISGWNFKERCPKPTRQYVLPGSVYFYQKNGDSGAFPSTLGATGDTIDGVTLDQGLGLYLKGVWKHDHTRT